MTSEGTVEQNTRPHQYLTLHEGKILIRLARDAIIRYLANHLTIKVQPTNEKLRRKSGVFVTLNSINPHELRGCIGFPYPEESLTETTVKAAICAATEDPRFPPILLDEFNRSVIVELTVLTTPRKLLTPKREKLPELVKVGQHGLVIEGMGTSGLLLPQVAVDWKWDATEFLTNCCLKAGLPPDAWLLEKVTVKAFEGEIFEEIEPAGEIKKKFVGG